MAQIEIHCPHHGNLEKIDVPDVYVEGGFEGDVRCAHYEDARPVTVKIVRGNVVGVKITRS